MAIIPAAKHVNLGQLHEELRTAHPSLPDGWGLSRDGQHVTDQPHALPDKTLRDAVRVHQADPDFGTDPDRVQLRDSAISELDTIIVNSQGYKTAELRRAVRTLAKIQRRIVRDVVLRNPSNIPPTPDD